ncbi:MAG: hypothetical protein MJE68_32360 [Proteobacteria bacterium]|nr:hypothetical protein [Pseudomonadota bacterium]
MSDLSDDETGLDRDDVLGATDDVIVLEVEDGSGSGSAQPAPRCGRRTRGSAKPLPVGGRGRGKRKRVETTNAPIPACHNPECVLKGRNRRYLTDDDYSTDEELHAFDIRSPTAGQEETKLGQNPPRYVFLRRPEDPAQWEKTKYPRICNGCKVPFADRLYSPPYNLVFRFQTVCTFTTKKGYRGCTDGPKNAYYHSYDLACLRREPELEMVQRKDLYIEQACYAQLTEDHIKLLRQCRHWVPIRRNRAEVIQNRF